MIKQCKYEVGSKHWDWTLLDRTILRAKVLCQCVCGEKRMVSVTGLGTGVERNCGCKDVKPAFTPVVVLKEPRAPSKPEPVKPQGKWYRTGKLMVYNSVRIPPMEMPERLCDAPKRTFVPAELREDNRYSIWINMINRCHSRSYSRAQRWYKNRGIRVCAEWFNFKTFCLDVGPRPDGMNLGRIDHDKGYYPENCRWMTGDEIRRLQRDTFTENSACVDLVKHIHKPLARTLASRVFYVEQEEVV